MGAPVPSTVGHGLRPARVHGCNSLSTMIRMTISGLGLAVLPTALMRDEIKRRQLVVLEAQGVLSPNRFLVAHQSRSFDSTVYVIADLAVELASVSPIFSQTKTHPPR